MPRTKQQKPRHIVDLENHNDGIEAAYFPDSAHVISKDFSEDKLVEDSPSHRATRETVTNIDGNKNFIDPCSPEIPLHSTKEIKESEGILKKMKQTAFNMDGAVSHLFKSSSVCVPPKQSLSNQQQAVINKKLATNESVQAIRNQDDTSFLQHLSKENTPSSNYVNDWLQQRKSVNSPTSNDVQYKVLSAAAAQYVQNIKMLMENKSSETSVLRNKKDEPVTTDFSSMFRSAGKQNPHHSEYVAKTEQSDNLVHSYMSHLSKRWTSIINQKLSKEEDHKSIYPNCIFPFGNSADQNSVFEPNDTILSEETSRVLYIPESPHGNIWSNDDTSSIQCSPSLKIPYDSTSNRSFKIASPHSAPASFSDQFSPWQQLAVPQRDQQTIRPWSSTGPLSISSPQDLGDTETISFPSPVSFSPIPNVSAHLKKRGSEMSYNLNTTSSNMKPQSLSSIKSSNQGCPKLSNSSSPSISTSCNSYSDISLMTKTSGNEIALYSPSHINTVCSQLQMPYSPISSKLIGPPKLSSALFPSPFGGLPASGIQTPLFLPGHLPLGGFSNSHMLTSHFGNVGQRATFVDTPSQVRSTVGKITTSRKSRSRGQPIDSVHAAIVREAKEQFKGLDPENMYIQCPICQKRIKRLYHFQRHMRIHTGEKTHQCPCCQYKSVRKDNLKSHMKTHEKQSIENSRRTVRENNFQERRTHHYADARKSSGIENNEEEPEKQQRALPAHQAANEYSASFTSSYASTYPFPYFPHHQYSSSPYVNISSSRLQQQHHRNKATVKGETSAIDIRGKLSSKSDSSSSDSISPDADDPANEITIVNNSAPMSPEQSTDKPKDMSNKNIFRAFENSAESLQQSDICLVKPCNENQNNSNSAKTGRIFRTWGSDEVKFPTTAPYNSTLDNSSITSTFFQNFHKLSAGHVERTFENLPLVKKEHQGINNQQTENKTANESFATSPLYLSNVGCDKDSVVDQHYQLQHPKPDVICATGSLQLDGTPCLAEAIESAVICSEKNNVKSEPENKSVQHSNGDIHVEKYDNALSPTKELLACRLCQFRAISNNDLQTHVVITHKHDGFYKCDVCNYLGKNLSKLVEHIRIHTGERPFKCDQCNYAAKRKDNLAQHKAVRHDKRKGKSESLYISVDPNNGQRKDGSDERFVSTKRVKKELPSKKSPLIQSGYDFEKSSLIKSVAGNTEKNSVEQGGMPYAPLFHKYSPAAAVHAMPPFMYPFYFPSPLMHAADLGGQVNGSHPSSAQLSNPGSYSLKVRAALITP